MKLLVDAPAFWPTEQAAHAKAWLYLASCKKFGITPRLYGIGWFDHYIGETRMRMDCQIRFLKEVGADYTHVLCTDAWDVLFCDPLEEIIRKYESFGSPPCLMGGTRQCLNLWPRDKYDAYFDLTKLRRYPSPPTYIAEIPYIIDRFERMDKDCSHDQTNAIMSGIIGGFFQPVIDYEAVLFQDTPEDADVVDGHLFNIDTKTTPSTLHISGGYMDPEHGRDHAIIPWAQRLGII